MELFESNGYLTFATHDGSSFTDTTFNTVNYNDDVWHHFCVQRSSGTVTAYVDGISIGTASVRTNLNAAKSIQIGREGYTPTYFTGYIQDLRIYKGVAKYTSDFVVPSRSPDILPDTPSGVVGGSKLAKITDGAVQLKRSGGYLDMGTSHTDLVPGSGDFTIECSLYVDAFANYPVIVDSRVSGANDTGGFFWGLDSTGVIISLYPFRY